MTLAHWREIHPGVFYLKYHPTDTPLTIGEQLDWLEYERRPGCFAVVEIDIDAHPSHLSWVVQRITGSGLLRDPGWDKPTDAGCIYGPRRAAAWRALEARHFGLPERRSIFVVASSSVDPAFLFDRFDARPITPDLDT